jgi:nitroreductase
VAFDQAAVEEAGVTFIVLGDLLGHERLPEILEGAVRAGTMSRPSADRWIESARRIYADRQAARDEAIRSASLAAMALMIAAAARGFASGPLIGFDPGGVRREFAIADRFLPVLLLCVGAPLEREARPRSRLGVDQVLSFDRGREF